MILAETLLSCERFCGEREKTIKKIILKNLIF